MTDLPYKTLLHRLKIVASIIMIGYLILRTSLFILFEYNRTVDVRIHKVILLLALMVIVKVVVIDGSRQYLRKKKAHEKS